MRSRPALLRLAAVTAGAALALTGLSACADAGEPVPAGGVQTSSGEKNGALKPQASPSPSAPARAVPKKTSPVDVELKGSDDVAVVSAYAVNGDDTAKVDTFQLTFTKPISGYTVRYVDRATKDPSGKPVKLKGKAVLQVVARNATLDNTPYVDEGTEPTTYQYPLRFKPRMLAISEVRDLGDFEATLSVGIGVSQRGLPFRVTSSAGGKVLTIDVAQPS